MTFTKKQKLEIANSMKEFFPDTFKSAYINTVDTITIRMTDYDDMQGVIVILEDWGFKCRENLRLNSYFCCEKKHIGYRFTF